MTRHWANALIGRSYEECGGCWGMVRMVFSQQLGVDMPEVAVGTEDAQASAILAASQASGWRPAAAPEQEHDILLMRELTGRRHVGVVVHANGLPGLLHCTELAGVAWIALRDLQRLGYTDRECWRRA